MEGFERIKAIKKADEIYEFSKKIFDDKKSILLRKAASIYKQATLGFLAEKIEKEAEDWEKNNNS